MRPVTRRYHRRQQAVAVAVAVAMRDHEARRQRERVPLRDFRRTPARRSRPLIEEARPMRASSRVIGVVMAAAVAVELLAPAAVAVGEPPLLAQIQINGGSASTNSTVVT